MCRGNGLARYLQGPPRHAGAGGAAAREARQAHVSRLVARADAKLSTLRDYGSALDDELRLTVTFPDGGVVAVKDASGVGGRGTGAAARRGK